MESGKPVPAGQVGAFTTADVSDDYPPLVTEVEMTLTEGCVFVRFITDEGRLARRGYRGRESGGGDQPGRHCQQVRRGPRAWANVPAGVEATVSVRATDRAGNHADSAGTLIRLPPKSPRVVITEVLGNPAGTEGTQEFVELQNLDPEPASLAGNGVIEDKTGSDALPDAIIPAGGFAVVVPEAFVVNEGKDPPPREDAVLVRVPGKLGADGLANAGEPVRLVKDGVVLSQYGGWVNTSATAWNGRSVRRIFPESCDQPSAWTTTPQAPHPRLVDVPPRRAAKDKHIAFNCRTLTREKC